MAKAREKGADFYAPKAFKRGMHYYEEAEEALKDEDSIESIQEELEDAVKYFDKALETTKKAIPLFTDTDTARSDALKAAAKNHAPELWEKAESRYGYARKSMEGEEISLAKEKAREAMEMYRKAELSAIKVNALQEARDLLEKAKTGNVKRYAPKTYEKAKNLLAKAEEMLERDRYETGKVGKLVRDATYEVTHSIYLNDHVKILRKEEKKKEDILLACEAPVRSIAQTMEIVPDFSGGINAPTRRLIEAIQKIKEDNLNLSRALGDKDKDVAELVRQRSEKDDIIREKEAEVAELKMKISTLELQVGKLATVEERLKAEARKQEMRKQKLERIKRTFKAKDATVVQDIEGNIIIRLYGLTFPEGMAVIEPRYFSILTKINESIAMFPGCRLVIEGHTDSTGRSTDNKKLSKERAIAIQEYVVANTNVPGSKIEAQGYGETRPVSTNDTAKGRAKNRRIDIIIKPIQ